MSVAFGFSYHVLPTLAKKRIYFVTPSCFTSLLFFAHSLERNRVPPFRTLNSLSVKHLCHRWGIRVGNKLHRSPKGGRIWNISPPNPPSTSCWRWNDLDAARWSAAPCSSDRAVPASCHSADTLPYFAPWDRDVRSKWTVFPALHRSKGRFTSDFMDLNKIWHSSSHPSGL